MIHLLDKDTDFGKAVRTVFRHDAQWLCRVLPSQIIGLRDLRNQAAHSTRIGIDVLLEVREKLLGELVRVRLRI